MIAPEGRRVLPDKSEYEYVEYNKFCSHLRYAMIQSPYVACGHVVMGEPFTSWCRRIVKQWRKSWIVSIGIADAILEVPIA